MGALTPPILLTAGSLHKLAPSTAGVNKSFTIDSTGSAWEMRKTFTSEAVNVLDYFAFNNNTNASLTTTAIQAAIGYAVSSGIWKVYFPPGIYLINWDTITVPAGVEFFGVKDKTIFYPNGDPAGAGYLFNSTSANNASTYLTRIASIGAYFHDFIISWNSGSNPTKGAMIKLDDSTGQHLKAIVRNVTILGSWIGIEAHNCIFSNISENFIYESRKAGIRYYQDGNVDFGDHKIYDNFLWSEAPGGHASDYSAILWNSGSGFDIRGNKIGEHCYGVYINLNVTETASPAFNGTGGTIGYNYFDQQGASGGGGSSGRAIVFDSLYGKGGSGTSNARNVMISTVVTGNIFANAGAVEVIGGSGAFSLFRIYGNQFWETIIKISGYLVSSSIAPNNFYTSNLAKAVVVSDLSHITNISAWPNYEEGFSSASDLIQPLYVDTVNSRLGINGAASWPLEVFGLSGRSILGVTSTANSQNAGVYFGAKDGSGTTRNGGLFFTNAGSGASTNLGLTADGSNFQIQAGANNSVSFFGTSFATQQANTTGTRAALQAYGLIAAGGTIPDYTLAEQTKLAGIATGATVGATTPLFDHYTNAGNTTTTETDLYSDTTAASALSANGYKIEAEYGGSFVSSATATREIKLYFGGTAIFDTGALTLSLSSAWTCYATLIRVSSTVVRYMISFATEGAALSAYTAVGELTGLTLSSTNVLKITGQAAGVGAATNDIVATLGNVYKVANA